MTQWSRAPSSTIGGPRRFRVSMGKMAVVMLAAPGCTGEIGQPAGPVGEGQSPTTVAAAVGGTCALAPTPLRRLTREQYRNAVRALLGGLSESDRTDVWRTIEPALEELPDDIRDKRKPFASQDRAVSETHVTQYLKIAEKVAQAVTKDSTRLQRFVGCDKAAAKECITNFLRRVGSQAYRRNLSNEELATLQSGFASTQASTDATRDVLIALLNAPQFLYRMEFGVGEPVDGVVTLSGPELATRLALELWQAPPDAQLLEVASTVDVTKDADAGRLVDQVLQDPRTRAGLGKFVREWLDLDALPDLDSSLGSPEYDAFVGQDRPSEALRDDMISDVVESFVFHARRKDSYDEWLLSPYSFARTEALSAIYRAPTWKDEQSPPTFPPGARAGLITRAAMVASGGVATRPILKGVRLRERLLCTELPPPDPAAAKGVPQSRDAQRTTREEVERLTEQPGTTCAGCHTTAINGLGFPTEGYDGLGRTRTHQKFYGDDGRILGEKSVDTRAVPKVTIQDLTLVSGAQELAARLAASDEAKTCFATQFARFSSGMNLTAGSCLTIEAKSLPTKGSLHDVVRALLMGRAFRTKVTSVPESQSAPSTPALDGGTAI